MSRLTKVISIHNNEPEFYEANIELYPKSMGYEYLQAEMDCMNKLGELEDIEEEIGCPLDVVFKALKEGIIYKEYDNKTELIPNMLYTELLNEETESCFRFINYDLQNLENSLIVKLKDYGKTWWLK